MTAAARRLTRHRVVDVYVLAVGERFIQPESGDGHDLPGVLDKRKLIALRLLPLELRQKVGFVQVRPQFLHDWKTGELFSVGLGEFNVHLVTLHVERLPHASSEQGMSVLG